MSRWFREVASAASVFRYYNYGCDYGMVRGQRTTYGKFFGIKTNKKTIDIGCTTSEAIANNNARFKHEKHMRDAADAQYLGNVRMNGAINRIGNIMEYGTSGW